MVKVCGWLIVAVCMLGCTANLPQLASVDNNADTGQAQMARGIKEALEFASVRASEQLSKTGGYSQSSLYRIELPEDVQTVAARLRQFGLGRQLDQVEALMNRGAEQAAVEARAVFVDAVRAMTLTDALGIVRGSNTAASDYFRRQTETILRQRYLPIIQSNLQQIGFYDQYRDMLSLYQNIPVNNKPDLDLEQHVLDKSLDGLFKQVAVEEQLIREDPLGRGSRLIESVFGRR
ncbi:MAG TPA: DUF4197 domain-containing protein [Cellvibrionaceae bacterium]